NSACPVTLGGAVLVPSAVIPPFLPLSYNNAISGGATFNVSGKAASANTQTVAGVTFNLRSHTINLNNTRAGNTTVLDPTTFTRNAHAVVNFATAGAGTSVIKAGGLANDGSGLLGGWAISGTNWATVSGGGSIVGISSYQTGTDPSTWASTDNVSLNASASAP